MGMSEKQRAILMYRFNEMNGLVKLGGGKKIELLPKYIFYEWLETFKLFMKSCTSLSLAAYKLYLIFVKKNDIGMLNNIH